MHWLSSLRNYFYACNVLSKTKLDVFCQKSCRWALGGGALSPCPVNNLNPHWVFVHQQYQLVAPWARWASHTAAAAATPLGCHAIPRPWVSSLHCLTTPHKWALGGGSGWRWWHWPAYILEVVHQKIVTPQFSYCTPSHWGVKWGVEVFPSRPSLCSLRTFQLLKLSFKGLIIKWR